MMQYSSWIGGGTGGWNDIDTATYSQQSTWSIPDNPNGVYFKPDGTKVFYAQNESSNIHTIRQADLSTPWDLTTAGSVTYMTCYVAYPRAMDIHFKPDGTILYYSDWQNDHVVQLSLSTPWDVTTSSLTGVLDIDSVTGEEYLRGLYISPDGEKLFVHGFDNDKIARFTLSTPWDITTGSYHSQSAYICQLPLGLYFKSDGTKVFSTDNTNDVLKQWNLSTPWDITGVGSAADSLLDVSPQTDSPTGVYIPDNGKYIFVGDSQNVKILRYLLNP